MIVSPSVVGATAKTTPEFDRKRGSEKASAIRLFCLLGTTFPTGGRAGAVSPVQVFDGTGQLVGQLIAPDIVAVKVNGILVAFGVDQSALYGICRQQPQRLSRLFIYDRPLHPVRLTCAGGEGCGVRYQQPELYPAIDREIDPDRPGDYGNSPATRSAFSFPNFADGIAGVASGLPLGFQGGFGECRLFSSAAADIADNFEALRDLGVTVAHIDFERPEAEASIAEMRRFREQVIERL